MKVDMLRSTEQGHIVSASKRFLYNKLELSPVFSQASTELSI